jgi:CheY-like chemotaxis protein
LVINARDAMPQGGSIAIRTERVSLGEREAEQHSVKPGDYVAIRVTDTGTGIDDELKRRIFEPFFTTKPAGEGTGLGLAMVYGMASAVGGTVLLESTLGMGSTFTVLLPITDKPLRSLAAVKDELMTSPKEETVLVVEDDPAVLDYLRHLLFDLGYRTLTAACGRDALSVARENRVSLLLCDVVMTDLSGIEVARTLKAEQTDLKVVLMSGYPFAEIEENLAEAKLEKPLDPATLAATLSKALG